MCVFVWRWGLKFCVCVLGGFKKLVRWRGGRKIWGQAGSLCRVPGTLVKRNKNYLCHYTKTEPVWSAVIPLLWCWDLGWALIERGGLLVFFPWKEGGPGLTVDLRYSHTLSQSKLLENHTQTTVISHRRRKRFFSSAGLLSRSEFGDRWHNTGFWDKSIVFLHFPRKFRGGQPGL